MTKILIVEDDYDIASLEKDYLEINNFSVDIIDDGNKALPIISKNNYDLIILDLMLPNLNGFEICKELRKFSDIPIIMVTAKDDSYDIIRGLGLGSDDYITKPFDPAVLVARVQASLNSYKRHKNIGDEIFINDIKIIPQKYQVFKGTQEIKLPNKEFELLKYLATHANRVISKEDLFEAVWGMESDADEATVTVHINRLREKIEENPSSPQIIETIWKVGYRLNLK